MLKAEALSPGDEQKKMVWPRNRIPLGKERDREENRKRNVFSELIMEMAVEMGLKQAS
jgi:hypothetical protein